jgi:hypothetical protein
MSSAGLEACTEEIRITYKIVVRKFERKTHVEKPRNT